MQELNDILEGLLADKNYFCTDHVGIAKTVQENGGVTLVEFDVFLGYHLPLSTVRTVYIDGEYSSTNIEVKKPVTEKEVELKIRMIKCNDSERR